MMLKSSREQALLQLMKFTRSDRPLLIIVASMILLVCFAVWSYLRLLETQSWSLHTYRMLTEISELETLTRQDRGLNLCVAIGDARLIETPGWERKLEVRVQLLKLLSRDNPSQQANIAELEQAIGRWHNEYVKPMQQLCQRVQSGELTPSRELSLVEVGVEDRARIKTLLTRIGDKEQVLLAERQQQAKTFRIFTSALLLLGIVGLVQLIWTFARSQMRATAALENANRQLQQTLREQQQTQAELADAEARASAVIENVSEAIVILDTAGIVRRFNRAGERIFGYRADDVLQRSVLMLFPADQTVIGLSDFAQFDDDSETCIIGSLNWTLEGLRRDGQRFPLELTLSQMRLNERVFLIALIRDITERRRIETMKNEFVSTVSHELRTPLTAIRGALGLINGPMSAQLPETLRNLVAIAANNSDRLVRLINDILDIEKIEAGHMRFEMAVLPLLPLLQQAIQANQAYAEQYKVQLRLRENLPDCLVRADSDRLMQLMANLLSNAAKFSPEGGEVEVDVMVQGREVRVSVIDRGPGIPLEFQQKMFQKFSQADSSDTRIKGGTGLGLSICKAIVEHMGGSIGFESEPGQGTTMYFTLPLLRTEPISATQPEAVAAAAPRLLVCEDDVDIAHLLQMMLQQTGYAVDIAYDADQALKMLLEGDYAAMTLDIDLPGKNGLSLLRELHRHDKTRMLRVVVVSAKSQEARELMSRQAQREEGMMIVDWIDKPIDQEQLLQGIGVIQPDAGGPLRVLHVEDNADVRSVIAGMLGEQCRITAATTLAEAMQLTASTPFDVIVLDVELPDGSGLDLLRHLFVNKVTTPVVVFSATELNAQYAATVSANLVKARTTDQQLLDTILGLAGRQRNGGSAAGKE